MNELLEKALIESLCKSVDGTKFYIHRHRNGQDVDMLAKDVKKLIAEHNMSVSEAKGFLEYMKLVIDSKAYLPQEK